VKIALPTIDQKLCSHFGHCESFAIYQVENKEIIGETWLEPPPHQPGILPEWLAKQGITHVITSGIGQRAIQLFTVRDISVIVGVASKPAKELVNDYLNNQLSEGQNSCDH
jgi:predicted Fe-Mo cluster-binding NifX family protein